ncbi:MAG: nucleoside deaminase [Clostridiales bacterium]|jgi:tRNA(adenine34) deaminase|nr:nucleoside deaminase [Clostridiales bacterium]
MAGTPDEIFMKEALAEAKKAMDKGEIPVGAVVVLGGEVIGRGHNLREATGDPTAHAEMLALREAARAIGHWRLIGCTLYVTLEPCPMCAGAVINGRVGRVCFGAFDPKAGCCGTLYDLTGERKFNHHPDVAGGVLNDECAALLKEFFSKRRAAQKEEK